MKAWIVGFLLLLMGLILVLGLWLLGYHLTGKRAFTAWKAERIAMGDRLEWKDLVPPPVSPEDNFAEHPLVKDSILEKGEPNPLFISMKIPDDLLKSLGDWREGRRDPLVGISGSFSKASIENVLRPMGPAFQELEKASLRPSCKLPVNTEEGEIPALRGFRAALRSLRLQAILDLRSGRQDQALRHLQTCLRVANHFQREPHLISALLRTALTGIAMQVVWEGVEDNLWNAQQLETIQADLSRIDLLPMLKLAWQAERQNTIEMFSATAEGRPVPRFWEDPKTPKVRLGALGRGWFYRNLLTMSRYTTHLVDLQDTQTHRVFPGNEIAPESWERKLRYRLDLVMARIAIPALGGQPARISGLQAQIEHAIVACALERHRLATGSYPERLEQLSPTYLPALPHDLVTGGPLQYSRKGMSFTLFQVGWDGKNDHGSIAWAGEGSEKKLDPIHGDWVWPHAIAEKLPTPSSK